MISDRPGLPSRDMRLALLSFENYLLANRNTEKPVLHIALSPAPEDKLDDEQLAELAQMYMQKMGYGNQPYITYKHGDTYNTHIHIVSVCVDEEGRKINDSFEHMEERNLKAELKKIKASEGDIRHQIGNTLKAVLGSYRFQTFGEYSAVLSTFNIEARQVRGEFKGEPYTGIIYSATDDSGKVVSPPFKSSRFGKRFGNERLEKKMFSHTTDFKDGKWTPAIHAQVAYVMRHARSREELTGLLKKARIDVIFRENEKGRIYGVTFIDHNRREVFNGSRMGKEFSASIYNELFKWWDGIPATERSAHTGTELWQHHSHKAEPGSALEQAAGIFSMETNPVDYEEEALARRMKKKRKAKRKSRGV